MGEGGLTLNRARLLRLSEGAARFATPVRALLDVVAWGLAASLAVYLRFDLSFPAEQRLVLSVGASAAVARTPGLDIEIIVSHAAQQEAMAPSPLKTHRKSAVATAL
jgi:hypothetical protein